MKLGNEHWPPFNMESEGPGVQTRIEKCSSDFAPTGLERLRRIRNPLRNESSAPFPVLSVSRHDLNHVSFGSNRFGGVAIRQSQHHVHALQGHLYPVIATPSATLPQIGDSVVSCNSHLWKSRMGCFAPDSADP